MEDPTALLEQVFKVPRLLLSPNPLRKYPKCCGL